MCHTSLYIKYIVTTRDLVILVIINNIGIKIHYRLSTSSHTINVLSLTVSDDDVNYEMLSSKLEEAEMQGLIM